jgi:hypothetical protein
MSKKLLLGGARFTNGVILGQVSSWCNFPVREGVKSKLWQSFSQDYAKIKQRLSFRK